MVTIFFLLLSALSSRLIAPCQLTLTTMMTTMISFQVEQPLSPDFNFYDKNNDSKITLKEFADAISSTEEDCRKLFIMGDKDG